LDFCRRANSRQCRYLFNKIREEQPELLTDEDIEDIYGLVDRSIELEAKILDWIFEAGELTMFQKKIYSTL
jgi:ribonucleoside-diphosphate reductase beta chain